MSVVRMFQRESKHKNTCGLVAWIGEPSQRREGWGGAHARQNDRPVVNCCCPVGLMVEHPSNRACVCRLALCVLLGCATQLMLCCGCGFAGWTCVSLDTLPVCCPVMCHRCAPRTTSSSCSACTRTSASRSCRSTRLARCAGVAGRDCLC